MNSDSVADRGPWRVISLQDGRLALGSDDFRHDVYLYVNGDFADNQQRLRYAETLAEQLNLAWAEQERFVKAQDRFLAALNRGDAGIFEQIAEGRIVSGRKHSTCPFCGAAPGGEHDPQCGLKAGVDFVMNGPGADLVTRKVLPDERKSLGREPTPEMIVAPFVGTEVQCWNTHAKAREIAAEHWRLMWDAAPSAHPPARLVYDKATRTIVKESAPPKLSFDDPASLPRDWEHPNWTEYRKTHCWRNHVGEDIVALWETFSLTQKKALAAHAEELASAEEWD